MVGPSGLGLVEGYFPEVSSVDGTDVAQSTSVRWEFWLICRRLGRFTLGGAQQLDVWELCERYLDAFRCVQPGRRELSGEILA